MCVRGPDKSKLEAVPFEGIYIQVCCVCACHQKLTPLNPAQFAYREKKIEPLVWEVKYQLFFFLRFWSYNLYTSISWATDSVSPTVMSVMRITQVSHTHTPVQPKKDNALMHTCTHTRTHAHTQTTLKRKNGQAYQLSFLGCLPWGGGGAHKQQFTSCHRRTGPVFVKGGGGLSLLPKYFPNYLPENHSRGFAWPLLALFCPKIAIWRRKNGGGGVAPNPMPRTPMHYAGRDHENRFLLL